VLLHGLFTVARPANKNVFHLENPKKERDSEIKIKYRKYYR
jgi:hypothetical protein